MKITYFSIAFIMGLFVSELALSETPKSNLITAIEVAGNKIVSKETILSRVKVRPGLEFSQEIITGDIKRLYATGLFSDVHVDLKDFEGGMKVIFIMEERPVVSELILDGNRIFKNKHISAKIRTGVGNILDRRELSGDISALKKLYEEKGLATTKIEYEVDVDKDTNRATVYILIEEGRRLRIKEVEVKGNKAFTCRRLLKLIKTQRDTLFSSGIFKEDVFKEDLKRLTSFYRDRGYMDVRVSHRMRHEKQWMYITLSIDEGRRYLVGEVRLSGNKDIPQKVLKEKLQMGSGKVFSRKALVEDIGHLQDCYFEKGYISSQMKASTSFNTETERVDVDYTIQENKVAYVRMIDIRGNTKTKDMVIRRELKLTPGERFDGQKLKRSKERLYNLGYFEEITYDMEDTSVSNQKDLIVNVKEQKTGEFSFGAGFSSVDRFVGFIGVSQKNFDISNWPTFTGGGQKLRLRAEFGSTRRDYELSFTEPWLFSRPISFGFDLYNRTHERSGISGYGYDEERRGGAIRLGKAFGEYDRIDTTYRLERVKVSNVSDSASSDIKKEKGTNTISSFTIRGTRDRRDNIFNPTEGYMGYISCMCAGGPFGGDKDFLKYRSGYNHYLSPSSKKLVLDMGLRFGIVNSFSNSEIPIYERFYAGGGGTLRGYRERRAGPKDPSSGDPVGGKVMLLSSAETTFPIVKVLKGAVFYDTGFVWNKLKDIDLGDLVSGVGVGFRVKTPIGPVKLDYGYPLDDLPGEEKKGRFYFSMSHGF